MPLTNTDTLERLARSLIGCPYLYGGKQPWPGMDCSGFAVYVLAISGNIDAKERSAAMLSTEPNWRTLAEHENATLADLIFYGSPGPVPSHVMLALNPLQVIGAHGGDHTTLSLQAAFIRRATVNIQPLHYRPDFLFARRLT